MSRAYPYLRPPPDVVSGGPWSRAVVDGTEPLPAALPDWDYDSVLRLARPITIDGLRTRLRSGLPIDAEIDLTVHWHATSSMLRSRAWRATVPPEDTVEFEIDIELPGSDLGGSLELVTSLTLRRPGTAASPAAPRRPGSVLWSDRQRTLLQGDSTLFPLAIADFHELPYPTRASWYLQVGDDLHAAALGSILLLANEQRPIVVTALAAAAAPSDADRRVLSTMRTDIVRTLVERALTDPDFTDRTTYPTGSLGALLGAVLRATFPAFTFDALRREREMAPAVFNSRLQDATDLLGEP